MSVAWRETRLAYVLSATHRGRGAGCNQLFSCDGLVLYCLFVVRSSTGGAKTVYVVFDVVKTKLADLDREIESAKGDRGREGVTVEAHLVSAGTRAKVLVREIELLDAERAETD